MAYSDTKAMQPELRSCSKCKHGLGKLRAMAWTWQGEPLSMNMCPSRLLISRTLFTLNPFYVIEPFAVSKIQGFVKTAKASAVLISVLQVSPLD